MSRIVTSLCGLPSFGTVGSPLIIGGSSGIGALSSYSDDIGDRATLAPGAAPALNTGGTPAAHAARQQSLGFAFDVLGTVLFDGFTALTGIPRKAASTSGKLSISFWISPDAASYGSVLCSPLYSHSEAPVDPHGGGQPSSWDYFDWLTLSPFVGGSNAPALTVAPNPPSWHAQFGCWPKANVFTGGATGFVGNAQGRMLGGTSGSWDYGDGLTLSGVAFADNAGIYTRASTGKFYHVMLGLDAPGDGHLYYTIAVNDTVIASHVSIGDMTATCTACTFPINWPGLKDNAAQLSNSGGYVESLNTWTIGGNFIDTTREINEGNNYGTLPEGDGMQGAVTELLVYEGVYLDWTNSTIRNKFHTKDATNQVWLPVDVGKNGATPTGSKPTIYCTGLPDKFVTNRATGQKLGTWGSLTLDFRYPGAL